MLHNDSTACPFKTKARTGPDWDPFLIRGCADWRPFLFGYPECYRVIADGFVLKGRRNIDHQLLVVLMPFELLFSAEDRDMAFGFSDEFVDGYLSGERYC